ncbi:MAG: twin-arginine translocation signal domain-containing protein [Streptosporangiaceae bacterium]
MKPATASRTDGTSRRRFLQASAAAVGAGAVVATIPGADLQQIPIAHR